MGSSGEPLVSEFDTLVRNPPVGEVANGLAVDLSNNEVYAGNADAKGSVGRFTPADEPVEAFGSEHITRSSALALDSKTGEVFVADEGADTVDGFILEPPGSATVGSESSTHVTNSSATLRAAVNPHGTPTAYRFEYGPCQTAETCAGAPYPSAAPVPDGELSGFGPEPVAQNVQGLQANTPYHARLVAETTAFGPVYGAELTFHTQAPAGETLLDGRAWEMVTPPQKHGARFAAIECCLLQAAQNGDAFVDWANLPDEANPAGFGNSFYVFFARGSHGWTSQPIATPSNTLIPPSVGSGGEYRQFSEDLSHGIVEPFGTAFTPLSPEASEGTPYLRSDYSGGNVEDLCTKAISEASSCYRPLVTAANVPAGTKFGECNLTCGPEAVGGSPDLSHVILSSGVQLTETPAPEGGLYEWSAGSLQLVSLLPEGEGGGPATRPQFGQLGVAPHAVSDDGSRVFWGGAQPESYTQHLYLRETTAGKATTIRLDLPQGNITKAASYESEGASDPPAATAPASFSPAPSASQKTRPAKVAKQTSTNTI